MKSREEVWEYQFVFTGKCHQEVTHIPKTAKFHELEELAWILILPGLGIGEFEQRPPHLSAVHRQFRTQRPLQGILGSVTSVTEKSFSFGEIGAGEARLFPRLARGSQAHTSLNYEYFLMNFFFKVYLLWGLCFNL